MNGRDIASFDPATQQRILGEVAKLKNVRSGFRHAGLEFSWPNAQHVSQADLKTMAGLQDLFFTHHFVSHRRWLGPWIVLAKRIVVAVFNRFLKITLVRQVELNQHVWNLALTVQHLEQRVMRLEQELHKARGEVSP